MQAVDPITGVALTRTYGLTTPFDPKMKAGRFRWLGTGPLEESRTDSGSVAGSRFCCRNVLAADPWPPDKRIMTVFALSSWELEWDVLLKSDRGRKGRKELRKHVHSIWTAKPHFWGQTEAS